jgi:hypothetical protein
VANLSISRNCSRRFPSALSKMNGKFGIQNNELRIARLSILRGSLVERQSRALDSLGGTGVI